MRELRAGVDILLQLAGGKADGNKPRLARVNPFAVHGLPVVVRRYEILDFHLLELAAAENEIARRYFVSESLAYLRDAEGQLHAGCVADVFEVGENALRGFGAQVGNGGFVAQRAHVCLEHQVEVARRRERADVARCGRWDEVVLERLGVHVVLENHRA